MTYKLIITQNVHDDLKQAAEWYENQQYGLSKKFLASVKESVKLLIRNPFAFAKILLEIRKANVKKFPYSLYYIIDDKLVTVFAVIHNSRSEKIWKKRIDK